MKGENMMNQNKQENPSEGSKDNPKKRSTLPLWLTGSALLALFLSPILLPDQSVVIDKSLPVAVAADDAGLHDQRNSTPEPTSASTPIPESRKTPTPAGWVANN